MSSLFSDIFGSSGSGFSSFGSSGSGGSSFGSSGSGGSSFGSSGSGGSSFGSSGSGGSSFGSSAAFGSSFSSTASDGSGSEWTSTLYFSPNAENPVNPPMQILHEALKTSLEEFKGFQELIQDVLIFKCNLVGDMDAVPGIWHEYVIAKSENWYWCFEKNNKGIFVQRSNNLHTVTHRLHGINRPKGVQDLLHSGSRSKTNIGSIFHWLYSTCALKDPYHVAISNCITFARNLFKAITKNMDAN